MRRKRNDVRILKVRRTLQQCCADNDLKTALATYENAMEEGVRIEAQTYYNLLNLCGGLGADRKERLQQRHWFFFSWTESSGD